MAKTHHYEVTVRWTGNTGSGTSGYRDYKRDHEILGNPGKPAIPGSSDPSFRGDPVRWNPEELLLAALSACHKLSYLHMCADHGVIVTEYADHAEGIMEETAGGSGRFVGAVLRPKVVVTRASDVEKALALHHLAHEKCFIANSVNFPVENHAEVTVSEHA